MKDISLELLYNLKLHEIHDIIKTCLLIPFITCTNIYVYYLYKTWVKSIETFKAMFKQL